MGVIAHHIHRFHPHSKERELNKCEGYWGIILESCLPQYTKIEESQGRRLVAETGMWI